MKRIVLAATAVTACVSPSGPSSLTPEPLVFERWSPPAASSYDVFIAARGDVVLTANRISRDRGATWSALDPRVGVPGRVEIEGSAVYLHAAAQGLVRWDLDSGVIAPIAGAPSFAGERTWRRDPVHGRFVAFHPIANAIAVEREGGWRAGALPQPSATERDPYIMDLESNGAVLLTISGWGVHRSTDAGATWVRASPALAGAGRDLLVLGDGRFVLAGGATAYLFDAAGEPAGTAPLAVRDGEATVCEDGSIVAAGRVTRDLGASWIPLASAGALELIVERAACGAGGYWFLVRSETWGYRLLRASAPGELGVAVGNWAITGPQAWTSSGPPIARLPDGTFLAAGLAWRDGDAGWTLREMPSRMWASGGVLFGIAGATATGGAGDRFVTSADAGVTWSAIAATGLDATDPEAFARDEAGALHVGQFASGTAGATDFWRATVWRSGDLGATWSVAYAAAATRDPGEDTQGEAHRFLGLTRDGAWIAAGAVSRDAGQTWTPTEALGDPVSAHLLPDDSLAIRPPGASGDTWRVFAGGGLGEVLATHQLSADGAPVQASSLPSVAFDEAGHAYVARGTPHLQIWRTTTPVWEPTERR